MGAGKAVMKDHEKHAHHKAQQGGLYSVADGVRAEGRADGALLKIFDGGGKSAGAERQCQVVSGFPAEVAGDLAAIVHSALNGGSGSYAVIQNHGHLAGKALLSKRSETH